MRTGFGTSGNLAMAPRWTADGGCGLVLLDGRAGAGADGAATAGRDGGYETSEGSIVERTLDDFHGTPLATSRGDRVFGACVVGLGALALFLCALVPIV